MLYMSNDGEKVFKTEHECREYEHLQMKRLEEEKLKRETQEMERKDRLNIIYKKYEELEKLIAEYGRDYGTNQEIYFSPFYEIVNALCR